MNYIWIIEMLDNNKWQPTVGCKLTQEDIQKEIKSWRRHLPYDKFRVVKYIPAQGKE